MKRIFKSISRYLEKNRKENERDLDLFESDLFYFLKILYVKGDLGEKDIRKRRHLSKDRFEEFKSFAIDKGYILEKKEPSHLYSLKKDGKEFLLEFRKAKQEKNNTEWIKGATIVLALSAIVSIIDILVNKTETKNYILQLINKILLGTVYLIEELVPYILIILAIMLSIKIIKFFIRKHIRKKKYGR